MIPPSSSRWRIELGDSRERLRELADASIDAVVTDPPYEIAFMGRGWDASGVAYDVDLWREALRVLKPGGYLLAFGATRTYHRMACAIEDAGFEIRDSIHWMYGSGFPKSLDVSKAIDKAAGARGHEGRNMRTDDGAGTASYRATVDPRDYVRPPPATDDARTWLGWGTALKPAHEPIVVARKPLNGTVAANVLAHGVGGINVDGCRVGDEQRVNPPAANKRGKRSTSIMRGAQSTRGLKVDPTVAVGRWPPNVVFSHLPACEAETCAEGCAVAELDAQSGFSKTPAKVTRGAGGQHGKLSPIGAQQGVPCYGDAGGASRFFPAFRYQAKPSRRERGSTNDHPTVKPIELMRWLVRLVTPRNGLVLDPFAGSGTTGVACVLEDARFVGVELSPDYRKIALARIEAAASGRAGEQLDLFGEEIEE